MAEKNEEVSRIVVDQMKKADLPQIMAIEHESFPSPWSVGMFLKELETAHARCLCVRIQPGNVIAAYIIFWLVADEVHLHNLAVNGPYRRQGLAFRLMKAMEETARKNEMTALTLEVRESNHEAIKLYRKCGFVVKGVRPLYYVDTREDALIMWAEV